MIHHTLDMVRFVSILFVALLCQMAGAQTYNIATYNGMTVNTCSGNFYDSGGSGGNYANNENYVVTFCSASGAPLYFDFTPSFNLDGGTGDTLFFYDGLTTADPLIAILVKSDDYGFSYPAVGTVSTCVTIQWKSNGSATDGGWQASISCDEPPVCADNPPAADVFGQATSVCNLNDYCGTTSGYYGEDAPYNFGGSGGSCPSPTDGLFAGTLENNSWLKFIASATSASFDFNVTGGVSCDGVQVGIFAYDTTTHTFTRKTPCNYTDGGWEGVFTLTATGLTIGNTYYMMIDGNAGSNCDYTIGAGAGVATVSAGADQTLCSTTTTISATGATGEGMWTIVSGGGTIADPSSATTAVTGLPFGTNVFRWTVTGGLCADAGVFDDVVIDITCLLPITLESFSGEAIHDVIKLQWTTLQETESDHFIVERAADGTSFTAIGTVQAGGTTTTPVYYTFTDDAPMPVNYYRLRQVDWNGQFSYSQTIAVAGILDARNLLVHSIVFDAVADAVLISYTASAEIVLRTLVADISGRTLVRDRSNLNATAGTLIVPVTDAEGILLVKLEYDSQALVEKLIAE